MKWISFVISMTEIALLARVVWDIAAMARDTGEPGKVQTTGSVQLFVTSVKWWTAYILASSILISVPALNALIHGTIVVMGHGMGAAIGIDGMVLFAAICWMIPEVVARHGGDASIFTSARMGRWVVGLNVSLACLIGWLTIAGTIIGVRRYDGLAAPEWLNASNPYVLAVLGVATAWFLAHLILTWLRFLFPAQPRLTQLHPRTEPPPRPRSDGELGASIATPRAAQRSARE